MSGSPDETRREFLMGLARMAVFVPPMMRTVALPAAVIQGKTSTTSSSGGGKPNATTTSLTGGISPTATAAVIQSPMNLKLQQSGQTAPSTSAPWSAPAQPPPWQRPPPTSTG